jgi:DNA-binding NarL/FixJ family response regulator
MVRVAVVDDHPFIVQVLTTAIADAGDLELAGVAGRADVVLLDHHLRGDLAGAELITRLRDAGMMCRMLLFTADEAVAGRAAELGADGAVSKRSGTAEVLAAIRRVAA